MCDPIAIMQLNYYLLFSNKASRIGGERKHE